MMTYDDYLLGNSPFSSQRLPVKHRLPVKLPVSTSEKYIFEQLGITYTEQQRREGGLIWVSTPSNFQTLG